MASTGQIQFKLVKKMLENCAKGYSMNPQTHRIWVYYDGREASLPKGPHGKRRNRSIEIGHIRHMVHHFQIEECASQHLPQLGKIKPKAAT
ncbi:MAG: hypothetical protein V3T83_08300 [Acidobacteriota bacterium]